MRASGRTTLERGGSVLDPRLLTDADLEYFRRVLRAGNSLKHDELRALVEHIDALTELLAEAGVRYL